jgi:outer membrane protein
MKMRKCVAMALVTLSMVSFQVLAQVQRVAIVNAARVLKESNAATEAKQRAEREFAIREKALVSQGDALKMLTDKYDAEVLNLTDAQRAQRRAKLAEQSREFQKKQNAFLEYKNAVLRADGQKMIALAKKVVKQVAEAEKFDLVMQDAVYVNPEFDITDKVIAGMNAESLR